MMNEFDRAITKMTDGLRGLCDGFMEAAAILIKAFTNSAVHELSEAYTAIKIETAPVSGRVKHLARHSRKYRVRRKNLNRIRRAIEREQKNA